MSRLGIGLGIDSPVGGGAPGSVPFFDLNFVAGTYVGDTLSNMLDEQSNFVGGLYEREDNGLLVAVGANIPQISPNGLEVWQNRQNRAIQSRNMTVSWVPTNVTPTRSTGRNGGANQGSRITVNANGGTIMLPADTFGSGPIIGAVDIFRVSGSGGVEMTVDGGTTWVALAGISGTFQRLRIPTQTLANPQTGFRFATAGDVFDMDYVTTQSGTILGPRVATTTVAVTCPQNRASCLNKPPLRDFIKGNAYTAYWEGKMDANSGRGLFISDANFNCNVAADGTITWGGGSSAPGAFSFGVYQKVAIRRLLNGTGAMSVNGGALIPGTVGSHAAITHFDIATNGAGAYNISGIVRRCKFTVPLSDADMIAWVS